MNELNLIIKAVAEHYKFEIKWCDVLNHWTICHESHNCNLFWRSDYDNSFETFFLHLQHYFEEIGMECYDKYHYL